MKVFKDYAYYYNSFYENKNYVKEATRIHQLLIKQNKKIQRILNMGCGTGRHDYELHKLGYEIFGIDLSQEMIRIAQKEYYGIDKLSFQVGDVRSFKSEQTFDSVVSLFHVMSYQNTNDDILSAFKCAYELLDSGGIFLFDVWYGPGVLSELPEVRVKTVNDVNKTFIRVANPVMHANENVVDVYYDVLVIDNLTSITQNFKEKHSMRYFFLPELKFYLQICGFQLLECLDCNTLQTPDYNSWTAYLIAKKI